MDGTVSFRQMLAGDEERVSLLVEEVFDEFVAPDFSAEGAAEFKRSILPRDLLERHLSGKSFTMVAEEGVEPVGMIDIGGGSHVRLFFVRRDRQGRGIGGTLMRLAVERLRWEEPGMEAVTADSPPRAVPVYESLGFTVTRPGRVKNGMRLTPMTLFLASPAA